jgi:D-tyrosyl-tRNA(Tyr) deacylase
MRAVVTRVRDASVVIDGRVSGAISHGFLVLLGVAPEDTMAQARKLADKICAMRIFEVSFRPLNWEDA